MTAKSTTLTRADIEAKINRLKATRINLAQTLTERDEKVAALAAKYGPNIESLATIAHGIESEIIQWAKDNRATEFGEAKTLTFASGAKIQFRTGNKQLVFAAGKDDTKIIAAMQKRRLLPFIKITKSLNRAAIISSWGTKLLPEKIAKAIGLRLEQKESVTLDVPLATAGKEQA